MTNFKKGFSFIEVIIAIGLVGAGLLMYRAVFSSNLLARSTEHKDIALKISNYKIEELRALGYSALPASGPFSDTLLTSLPSGSANITVSDFNVSSKQVVVTVSWVEDTNSQSVSLTTLLAETGGL